MQLNHPAMLNQLAAERAAALRGSGQRARRTTRPWGERPWRREARRLPTAGAPALSREPAA